MKKMKTPPWLATVKTASPRAYYTVATLLVFLVIVNLLFFALLAKADPRSVGGLLQVAILLCVVFSLMHVTERVAKLEKARKTDDPGPLVKMIADAKAAARLSGYDETQVEAVAKEVLTTCVKASGGWKA
jgi:hypothetical protein